MIPAIALLGSVIELAPALVKVLGFGSNAEDVANRAADLAKKLTGTDDNESALASLKANPELFLTYQQSLLEHEVSLAKVVTQDKESARLRDVEFLKAGTRNYRADFLVGVSVIVVFTILAVVILEDGLNEYAKGALTTILGVFLNQLTNVFSFEFGTTRDIQTQNNSPKV